MSCPTEVIKKVLSDDSFELVINNESDNCILKHHYHKTIKGTLIKMDNAHKINPNETITITIKEEDYPKWFFEENDELIFDIVYKFDHKYQSSQPHELYLLMSIHIKDNQDIYRAYVGLCNPDFTSAWQTFKSCTKPEDCINTRLYRNVCKQELAGIRAFGISSKKRNAFSIIDNITTEI